MSRWLRDLLRTARWHRRILAAALLAASMAFALHALAPPPPPTVRVVAAVRDLAAGQVIGADDVAVEQRPADSLPEGAVRLAEAEGATVVSPVRRGELLTDVRLMGPSVVASLPAGQVAVPVRIADADAVRLVSPGDVVDILAAGASEGVLGAQARLVAAGARVVTVPQATDDRLGASLGDGALVVFATSSSTAARLAGAAVTERLSLVLRRER